MSARLAHHSRAVAPITRSLRAAVINAATAMAPPATTQQRATDAEAVAAAPGRPVDLPPDLRHMVSLTSYKWQAPRGGLHTEQL